MRSFGCGIAPGGQISETNLMQYHIRLMQSEEGWAVSCPGLPGCHSQGTTRQEAMDNIRIAIREWLEVEADVVTV